MQLMQYAAACNSNFQSVYSITSSCNPRFSWSANGWFQKERCYYIFHSNHTACICIQYAYAFCICILHMHIHMHCAYAWFWIFGYALLTRPVADFTLHCSDKSNTPPEMFKHPFYRASAYWRAMYWYSKSVCPSVCPSVRPLRSGTRWKRLNMSS